MPRFLLLCLLLALGNGWAVALGQDSPQGHPLFSARFEPADLGLEPQNWAVVQDPRGVVVVGNNRGIATYDGRTWRSQPIPNRHVRSLVVDTDGQVFVGGIDEMGQLRPDSLGQLRYESLRHLLPDEDYGEMWNVLAVGNAVVFQGRHHLLFWDGQRFEVVQPGVPVSRTHSVGDTLFVHLRDQPLHRWAGGRLEPIAGTEALAEASLFALHQLPNGGLLIGTRAGEFYCLKMGRLDKLPFDGRAYFERHRPYSFAGLPTETGEIYAIGTIGGGIVLLDQDGRWLDAVPLPEDHWVLDLAFDHQGGLWAALYNGVVRVDVVPSIRRYDAAQGLRGIATEVVPHGGALYATTSQGVFRSSPSGSTWEALLSEHGQAWALGQIGPHLLAATDAGLYDLAGPEPVLVLNEHTYILHEVLGRPGYAYAGLKDGLMLLRVDAAGVWTVLGRVAGVEGDVFSVGQRGDTLWVSLADGGLLLLDLREDLLAPAVAPLPIEDRPEGRLFYTELDGAFAAAGEEGVYRAETKPGGGVRLRPDVALNEALALDGKSYLLLQEVGETLWAVRGRELFLLERTPTGYRRQARPDLPLVDLHITHIASDGPYVWLATEDGLLRYDPTAPKRYDAAYLPLFRRVMRGSRLLFGGAHGQGRLEVAQRPESKPVLAFSREELRFEVAAPSFNAPERIEYQYLLDGFDRDWSAWTTEAVRTYTNLPERALYTFRVRARNVHGIVSEEAQFALRVLPPWYRSIWAYAVYVLLVVVSLWALTAYRVRIHRNELSRERMMGRQLTRINEELASSNERLAEADTLKTSLLQNVSHELRTPLTAMLGSAELLTMHLGEHDPDGESLATSILSSTERLAGTVQDMMDV
ncbi:MAG: histidine kinase dimerization/phospho-acceptor domain-containing protein, partial [Bacteroidota bacterium]